MASTASGSGVGTMNVWRKRRGHQEPVWASIPIPSCPSDGYLVKLIASGVCHSDDAILSMPEDHYPPYVNDEFTLGHEGCGEVIEVGSSVQPTETGDVFGVGDLVACLCVPGCGSASECGECARGMPQLCGRGVHHGLGQDGFYAPFVACGPRAVVRLPSGVSPPVAAVATDAVLTAYHGIMRRAEVKKDETVFLFGLGGLGFNALQILRWIGARVIVSDIRQERLDEAVKLGVPQSDTVPAGTSVQTWVRENGLSNKIDTVLDFVGARQTFDDDQHIVRIGGKILAVGILNSENTVYMTTGILKRTSIIFTYGGHYRDLVECLDLIAKGFIRPQVETARLEDFPTVLKDLCNGKVKARMALLHGDGPSFGKGAHI